MPLPKCKALWDPHNPDTPPIHTLEVPNYHCGSQKMSRKAEKILITLQPNFVLERKKKEKSIFHGFIVGTGKSTTLSRLVWGRFRRVKTYRQLFRAIKYSFRNLIVPSADHGDVSSHSNFRAQSGRTVPRSYSEALLLVANDQSPRCHWNMTRTLLFVN